MLHKPQAAFRGTRDYFHSTDMYEEILAGAAAAGLELAGPLSLDIRQRITREPEFRFSPGDGRPDGAAASCVVHSRGAPWLVAITEGSTPIAARKPYDEAAIWSRARQDGQSLVVATETGMRPIEVVTALAVQLLKLLLPPPPGRRWLLGRLELSRLLADRDAGDMTVTLERTVGTSMTRLAIGAADGQIGHMVFLLR